MTRRESPEAQQEGGFLRHVKNIFTFVYIWVIIFSLRKRLDKDGEAPQWPGITRRIRICTTPGIGCSVSGLLPHIFSPVLHEEGKLVPDQASHLISPFPSRLAGGHSKGQPLSVHLQETLFLASAG